jgi:uncharacterized protein (TIGR00251 family)
VRLLLKVIPKSSRNRIVGWVGDRLKVAVTAPPERGKANEAVLTLVAQALELPPSAVRLVSGEASARKCLEIDGLDEAGVKSRLGSAGEC